MKRWTIFWADGPHDNPIDGEFEVEADNFENALAKASKVLQGETNLIIGFVRNDVLGDLS